VFWHYGVCYDFKEKFKHKLEELNNPNKIAKPLYSDSHSGTDTEKLERQLKEIFRQASKKKT